LEIIPASPRYQERVTARIVRPALSFGSIYGATTAMSNNVITVTYFEQPELDTSSHDVSLGQLPAGTYTVELRRHNLEGVEATMQFTVAAAVTPNPATATPSVNFTGQWWHSAEPGWGLAIEQGPTNLVFAEWFAHDATGAPVWYTLAPGGWTNAGSTMTFSGPIFRTTGSYWQTPFADPPVNTVVGSGELNFRDSGHGTMNFVIDGVRTIKPIERLPIE
jgi:hypothetical protein